MNKPPEQPQTKQLAAVPAYAIELKEGVRAATNASIETASSVRAVIERLVALEKFKAEQDARLSRTSDGVRGLSLTDQEQAAQLGQERAAREALAKEVGDLKSNGAAILAENKAQTLMMRTVLDSPTVKKIGYAAGALILQVLALATAYLALRSQ